MTDKEFDSIFLGIAKRWPWDKGEEIAMRGFRERLKVRAVSLVAKDFGAAVDRLVARDWSHRPTVEQIVEAAAPYKGTYTPLEPTAKEEILKGAATLRAWREKNLPKMLHPSLPVAPKPSEILKERVREAAKDWRDEVEDDLPGDLDIPF